MKEQHTTTIGRRPVLKGAGMALAGLGGLTGSAVAEKGSNPGGNLADTPAGFALYWSSVDDEGNDPDEAGDFGFPLDLTSLPPTVPINPANAAPDADGDWFLVGADAGGGAGLFDGSNIEITTNHKTLHHDLRVFAGFLMEGKAKPYALVNQGDGVFESRGQSVNFDARSAAEIEAMLALGLGDAGLANFLVNSEPIRSLAGGKWRAVASERLAVDLDGGRPYNSNWASTRVDFYSRGDGRTEYHLSMLFTLWGLHDPNAIPANIVSANTHAGALITQGRLNPGGQ